MSFESKFFPWRTVQWHRNAYREVRTSVRSNGAWLYLRPAQRLLFRFVVRRRVSTELFFICLAGEPRNSLSQDEFYQSQSVLPLKKVQKKNVAFLQQRNPFFSPKLIVSLRILGTLSCFQLPRLNRRSADSYSLSQFSPRPIFLCLLTSVPFLEVSRSLCLAHS